MGKTARTIRNAPEEKEEAQGGNGNDITGQKYTDKFSCTQKDMENYYRNRKDGQMTMTLRAEIKLATGEEIIRYFDGFDDLAHWMERHFGQYTAVNSSWIRPGDFRQGRMNA
jgi:hypothetical protein